MGEETGSNRGIDELITILLKRIPNIANRSLKRFKELYQKHPGFEECDVPFREEELKNAKKPIENLDKIVFLLGAGTSESAGLPLASEIVKHCEIALGKRKLIDEITAFRQKQAEKEKEEKVRWFSGAGQREKHTFEEVLSAYQRIFDAEEAIQLLKANYLVKEDNLPQKTFITLFNECLAHLVRERLVDFIVTFNFDELLEHSLKEDIGPHSYVRVSSPATFRWAVTHGLTDSKNQVYSDPDQRTTEMGCERAKVWLLKPHGTISHENTLRHSIEQVWRFEKEKEECLKRVFKNSYVVVVGYSLSAADLHRILITHALSGSIKGLFWVNPDEMPERLGKNLEKIMEEKDKEKNEDVDTKSFFHIKMKADDFALELFEQLYSGENLKKFKDYGLLPPFRHFLRAFVFQKGKEEDTVKCTFVNRFIVELVNHCIRMKGWFSSRTIDKCHQIKHLLDSATQTEKNEIRNLPDKLEPFFESITRKNRAERLYILRKKLKNSGKSGIGDKFIKMIEHCIPSMVEGYNIKSTPENKNIAWANQAAKMASQLKDHQDVAPYQYHTEIATFKNLLIIPNKTVLNALTKWLFRQGENLYIVSECCAIINNLKEDIEKFSKIGCGDYEDEKRKIINKLEQKQGEPKNPSPPEKKKLEYIYLLDDIYVLVGIITEIEEKLKQAKLKGRLYKIPTHRKRFHFNFWHDEENERVFGIIFNRIDRQAGTTFNWIKLDLKDPIENSQFYAYIDGYLKEEYLINPEAKNKNPAVDLGACKKINNVV